MFWYCFQRINLKRYKMFLIEMSRCDLYFICQESKWPLRATLDKSRWMVGTGIPLLLRVFGNDGILYRRLLLPYEDIGVVKFSLLRLAEFDSNPYFIWSKEAFQGKDSTKIYNYVKYRLFSCIVTQKISKY